MKGTAGKPDPKINKMALAGLALKSIGGAVGDGKAGNLMQGLGGLLGGSAAQGTNAATGGTNQPKSGGLLQGLGGILGGSAKSPSTNAPSQTDTNQSPLGNALNQLFKPKK
jgi:hypothetical protein